MFLATGCGTNTEASPAAPTPAPTVEGIRVKPVVKKLDAAQIVKKLKADKLGLTSIAVQNEDTDPNHLLGRPGGYTSRASADLPGGNDAALPGDADRGVVVEVYGTAAAAKRRGDYIASLKNGSSILGSEWQFYTPDGTGLIRVSAYVKPSLAKKVQAATADLHG